MEKKKEKNCGKIRDVCVGSDEIESEWNDSLEEKQKKHGE